MSGEFCPDTLNSKPAKILANIKTQKRNWPYRHIISRIGTPIENLAKWVEYHLKLLSRQHKAYIKDTTHFLNYLEDLNISKGPFNADSVLLVTRDIANFTLAVTLKNVCRQFKHS